MGGAYLASSSIIGRSNTYDPSDIGPIGVTSSAASSGQHISMQWTGDLISNKATHVFL